MVDEGKNSAASELDAAEAMAGEERAAEGGAQASAEELSQQLAEARKKADENWSQYLRAVAEQDNLRKRAERDLENAHKYALERFALELLPVKDSLEMGLAAAGTADAAKLKEGTELTLRMLTAAMEKFNVREVNPQGEKFNPELHQAMSLQPREDMEPDHVAVVVQKGYVLNDRLIRPALVIVSRAPDTPKVDTQA